MEDIEIRQVAARTVGDRADELTFLLASLRGLDHPEGADFRAVWSLPSYRAKRRYAWSAPVNLLRDKLRIDL